MGRLTFLVLTPHQPGDSTEYPALIMGASLNAPNKDIAGEAIRPVKALRDRGYKISRLIGDLGYAQLGAEKYQKPMRDLGVPVLMGFKKDQLGLKCGVGGTLQVGGGHLCPSTPKNLINASVDHANGLIDDETWAKRTAERQKHKTRRKEKPDASGHYPMMCPAYGPQATVECPLRKIHPNASKKTKPVIDQSELPEAPTASVRKPPWTSAHTTESSTARPYRSAPKRGS